MTHAELQQRSCLSQACFSYERSRDVVGFPGYRVDREGRFWSSRYRDGQWRRIKGRVQTKGYISLSLRRDDRTYDRLAQRLVLEAFVGPCPRGMEACHENNVRTDNRLDNLRWDTPKANQADRIRHGTVIRGESSGAAKISDAQAVALVKLAEARKRKEPGSMTYDEIARYFGISKQHVWQIAAGVRRPR